MPDLALRKQRLRTLENEIRDGLLQGVESFYYVGMKLKEIRDQEYWKDEGFRSWTQYLLSERLDLTKSSALQHIKSAEYRQSIGARSLPQGPSNSWTHEAFKQITRVPLKEAPRIAKKVEVQAEKKGVKLTRAFVREIVDHELDEPRRQPKPKPSPSKDTNGDGNVHHFLARYTAEIEGMCEALEDVPQAGWTLLYRTHPQAVDRLLAACDRLSEFLREKVS